MTKVIICDIDGTLANCDHRLHYVKKKPKEFDKFHDALENDKPNQWCKTLINKMSQTHHIVLMTGRPEKYRERTLAWLDKYGIWYENLIMRPEGDNRSNATTKLTMLKALREEGLGDIEFALDDNPKTCKMWRDAGITCLQVDYDEY